MKKTKKALASLAIAGMVLSMAPASVFAAPEYERLAGPDRYATSIAIAEKAYSSADTAVVAAGNPANLVDALAAAPLAAQEDAPIFLTDKADMNDDVVKSLNKLGVKDVIVVGAAASKAVQDELKAAGFAVEAVQGANRVETAAAVNAKLTAPAGTIVVGYNGVADAMSVASYAAANNFAIVVANQNGTVASGTDADFILGGPTLVKDIAGAERIFGADRYETNAKVIAELEFDFAKVYVGNGLTLADALVGSVLAAQTDSPILLTDGKTVEANVASNLTDDSVVVALGGTGVVSNAVLDAVVNPPATPGAFALDSVSAVAADAFAVKFSKAPADTSKVTFEVKQGETVVSVSPSWDGATATLKKSSKFVVGDYTVVVKEGDRELGSKNLSITEQKIAKIEIVSDKLGVTTVNNVQTGYATYKVLDQYGVDITNAALARNIDFRTGVGSADGDKGLLKVTPDAQLNLLTFSSGVVISAHDTDSGVSTTKNLSVTSQIGTLSDFTFKAAKDLDLVAGDTSKVLYLDYTATDISGNTTNNLELLEEGLIFVDTENGKSLTTSHPNVIAELVEDAADSKKGLIKVRVVNPEEITIDMPVVITAMTWTGKNSQVELTLKKQDEVSKFKLYAPADVIASDEDGEIPFAAYDQNGKEIKKFVDLDGKVTLSGAKFFRNVDGTASIKVGNDGLGVTVPSGLKSVTHIVTSVVKSNGDYSQLNLRIQEAEEAESLSIDSSVVKNIMQEQGAKQTADFGWDEGGFTVKDQYGREMDMTTAKASDYKLKVTPLSPAIVNAVVVDGEGSYLTTGASYVQFTSGAAGTATVRFELLDAKEQVVDTKSLSFTSLAKKDIKDYSITQLEKAIYAVDDRVGEPTDFEKNWNANPKVYGKTAAGADVVLAGTPVVSAVSTSDDFKVFSGFAGGAYDSIKVLAHKPKDLTKTEASGYITATILGADGYLHTATTPVQSSTAKPAAASLSVIAETYVPGVERDGKVITITGNAEEILGNTIAKFNYADHKSGLKNVYFAAKDQYGKTGNWLAQIQVLKGEGLTKLTNEDAITINQVGIIGYNATIEAGDYITVSGTTANGLVETVKIVFASTTVVGGGEEPGEDYAEAIAEATAAVELAEASKLQADVNAAKALVNDLPAEVAEKAELQDRIDAIEVEVGENEIVGELKPDLNSETGYILEFDVVDIAKVTEIKLGDKVLSKDAYDYGVNGNKITVLDVAEGDILTLTIDEVVWTVIF